MCQNSTLDQVSLCTPGRLNNMAPWLVPPALWADSPDPEAPLSLFLAPLSHLPLIVIQPGMPFALYGLLACSTNPPPPPPPQAATALKYSFTTQNHIISLCFRRQLNQIEHVSPVGGGECFPALDTARPEKRSCPVRCL